MQLAIMWRVLLLLLLLQLWVLGGFSSQVAAAGAELRPDFYANTCPDIARIVRRVMVDHLIIRDLTAPAALLRLLFHDCQVQGCDASILLDTYGGIVSEREAAANFGVRRLDFIDKIKSAAESACPNTVSCADIVVLAARDSVRIAGGPYITPVALGRRDSTTANSSMAAAQLPPPDARFSSFVQIFASKGMSLEESVAILGGGHTLGVGHCVSIEDRLYPGRDRSLGPLYYNVLRLRCSAGILRRLAIANDLTSFRFDTQYFKHALGGRGLFRVDSDVATEPLTRPIVQRFSGDRAAFFRAFSSAFLKLSLTNVLTGAAQGQVRQNCHFVNT